MSSFILACLKTMAMWVIVHCDDMFGSVLVNDCINCHLDLNNCTTDLYLLLYCYSQTNCLSLKLLVWCLSPHPKLLS